MRLFVRTAAPFHQVRFPLSMKHKQGYCLSCHQNKRHHRIAGVFSTLNLISLGCLSLLGISTWSCDHCRSKRIFLWSKGGLPVTEKSSRTPTDLLSELPPNDRLEPVGPNDAVPQESQARQAESAGNYIRTDRSLVVQATRSRLYSQKYRDGVVHRILSGVTTISDVRESLGLSEADVIDWIKQTFGRKEQRVEELRSALRSYQRSKPDVDVDRLLLEIEQDCQRRLRLRTVETVSKFHPSSPAKHERFADSLVREGG